MNQQVLPRVARRASFGIPMILALEPRLMFDGAAVVDAAHQVDAAIDVAPTPVAEPKEVAFVDTSVSNWQALAEGLRDGVEVVLIEQGQSGLEVMAQWAQSHSGYDAIHVLSHGADGTLNLGSDRLDAASLDAAAADLAALGGALTDDGDILLYGCKVAADEVGEDFLARLAAATGADVAASDDLTGAARLGGDWDLEKSVGAIGSEIAATADMIADYDSVLVDATLTFESDNGSFTGDGTTALVFTETASTGGVQFTFTAKLEGGADDNVALGSRIGALSSTPEVDEDVYFGVDGKDASATMTIQSGKAFDLISFYLSNQGAGDSGTSDSFDITTSNGGTYTTGTLASAVTYTLITLPSTEKFKGITWFKITPHTYASAYMEIDTIVLKNITNAPTLATPSAITLTDTAASDSFSNSAGTLVGSDTDGTISSYGIDEGATGSFIVDETTYDVSKGGTYGTLYVISTTGAYLYKPEASAVNAVTANQSETFTVTTTDNNHATGTATLTINVTGANDTPVLSAPSAASYTDTTASDSFSNTTGTLSATDADTGATKTYGINTGATGGSTDVGGTIYDVSKVGSYGTLYVKSGTGAYVYVPSATNINAVASGASPTDTFTVTVSDGALSDSKTYTVNITGADDVPTASGVPASVTVTEDVASNVNLTAIALSDVDTSGSITVTIAAGAGTLHSSSGGGVTVSGSTTGTLTLVGTVANIDSFLNTASNIQYLGASNANGSPATTLTITANDGGAGGTVTLGTVNVNITAINDDPTASGVPAAITVTEDVAGNVDLTGITLSDVDAGGSSVTFTITAAAGTLTASSGGGVTVTGSGTGALALAGTVANINTFLGNAANIKYTTASNSTTATSLALKVNDGGNSGTGGGGDVALGTVTVNITAINDDPSALGVPAAITVTEDVASNVDLTGITLSDVDAGGSSVTFTITAAAGTLTASSGGGVTVTGSGTGALALAGTVANINTFLGNAANIKYTTVSNSITATSLALKVNDGGNSGTGGGGDVALGTVTVNVTAVADTPSVTNASTTPSTQTTSGLVLSRNAADGTEVTHFKITGITGGTLYKNDGVTVINNTNFITYAEGAAGLKFTPSSGDYGYFVAQASTSGADGGLGGSTVTATIAVGASVDSPTINEDNDSGAIVITKGSAETHYKITGITGGILYSDVGYTNQINDNEFIACAGATTNVYFRPTANFNGSGGFVMQASTAANDGGLTGSQITSTITVTAVADTPTVSSHTVAEDSTSQAVTITRSANDGAETTHYKITGITGGSLYSDAALTQQINSNGFVASAGATTTVYFVPTANRNATTGGNGSFTVQASKSNGDGGLGGSTATSAITLTAVADTPSVASPTVTEDTDSGAIAITRSANDGAETTYYKITGITGGILYSDVGYTTQINNGDFIASAGATTNVYFRPTANRNTTTGGDGAFTVQASSSNADAGLGGSTVTSAITLTAVADTPSVTNASTPPATQTTTGLVLSRNAADGAEVTHFKITSITGGTLYKNDGVTVINNTNFITYAEGAAGLKFTPSGGSGGSFTVQASKAANDGGLGGSTVNATISINTAPEATGGTLSTTGRVGTQLAYSLPAGTFTDADAGDTLTYSATGLPAGLSINAATGAISGSPTASGTSTVTITATDSGGLTATKTIIITVEDAAASGNNADDTTGESNTGATTITTVTTVTTSITTPSPPPPPPPPPVPEPEPPAVVRTVTTTPTLTTPTDNAFQVVVVAKSPGAGDALLVNAPLRDAFIGLGGRISVTIPSDAFASTRADAVVTLSATRANGAALPGWMSFNPHTGTFEGTPPPGFKGEVVVKVTARDNAGRMVVQTFKIVVGEAGQGGQAPVDQGEPGRSGAADGLQDQVLAKPVGKPGLAAQLKSMSREGRQAQQLAFVEALKRGGRAA